MGQQTGVRRGRIDLSILRRWRDLFASLGESLIDVAEAEVAALKQDLRDTGRRFSIAVAIAVVAAILAFWAIGATGFVIYQVLAIWLPGWGAASIVLGILLLVTLILGMIARRYLRDLEAPIDTVKRRVDNHLEWWQSNLLIPEDHDERSEISDQSEPERLEP